MKKSVIIFLILSSINLLIYYFRDFFAYIPYASYEALYTACDKDCEGEWNQIMHPYDSNEIKEARRILRQEANIDNNKTTLEKVLSIAAFEFNKFGAQSGKPSAFVNSLTPIQQYNKLCESKNEKIWCGNYALMFSFFCWSENIICRYIEIHKPGNHHVVNECYIPEIKQWVLVDVTGNNLLFSDNQSRYLNLQQVINRASSGKNVDINALSATDTGVTKITLKKENHFVSTYYSEKNPLYYHLQHMTKNTYAGTEKAKRYVLPVSWYKVYHEPRKNNLPFYIKCVFILSWLASLLFLARQILRNRNT